MLLLALAILTLLPALFAPVQDERSGTQAATPRSPAASPQNRETASAQGAHPPAAHVPSSPPAQDRIAADVTVEKSEPAKPVAAPPRRAAVRKKAPAGTASVRTVASKPAAISETRPTARKRALAATKSLVVPK